MTTTTLRPSWTRLRSRRLVAVQLRDAFFGVGLRKLRAHPFRHGRKFGFARRNVVHGGNDFAEAVALGELLDDFADARECDRVLCGPHRERLSQFQSPLMLRLLFATLTWRRRQRNDLLLQKKLSGHSPANAQLPRSS